MALASSLSAAPPPLTWATSSPSSPAQLPSASAAPSSPASTALLPLAPERHQLVHRRTQIWLHPRSQCLSTAPLPVLVSAASASATPLSARQHWLRSRRWLHRWHLPWRRMHCHPWHLPWRRLHRHPSHQHRLRTQNQLRPRRPLPRLRPVLIALSIICSIGLGMRNRVTDYLADGSILSGIMTLDEG